MRKTIPKIAYTGREFKENFIFQATFAPKLRHFFCFGIYEENDMMFVLPKSYIYDFLFQQKLI